MKAIRTLAAATHDNRTLEQGEEMVCSRVDIQGGIDLMGLYCSAQEGCDRVAGPAERCTDLLTCLLVMCREFSRGVRDQTPWPVACGMPGIS